MASDYLIIRKEVFECPVCHKSEVNSFLVFPCGHSVCQSCAVNIKGQLKFNWRREPYYECPICYHRVVRSTSGSLSRNFAVQSLLESAITLRRVKFSSRYQRQLMNGQVGKRDEFDRLAEIDEQWRRIQQLEIVNSELQGNAKRLRRAAWFSLALVAIFFATALTVYDSTMDDKIPWCPTPVSTEPKTIKQRILDVLLLQETIHQPDMAIVEFLHAYNVLSTFYEFYGYVS